MEKAGQNRPARAREVVPGPCERSIIFSTSTGRQLVAHRRVVGALNETMVAVVDGSLAPVTAAIRLMTKAMEVHVGSLMACEELGHKRYLPATEVAGPLERAVCQRLHSMEVPLKVGEVPLGGGMITVDLADDTTECRGAERERLAGCGQSMGNDDRGSGRD